VEPVVEWPYTCPFCWEQNTVLVDLSAPPGSLIEDCSVCCRPILLEVTMSPDGIDTVRATRGD
jgi:transcription elongation factor Elf1